MSTDTEGGESSTKPGGSRPSSNPSSQQASYTRVGVLVAVLLSLGGLLLIWMMFVGGSKKATSPDIKGAAPAVPARDQSIRAKEPSGPQHPLPAPPPVPWYKELDERRATDRVFFITRPQASTSEKPATSKAEPEDYVPPLRTDFPEKLPGHLEPIHYDVMFKVILDARQEQNFMYGDSYFLGKTIILLRCLKPTQTIFLHATGFTVKEQQTTLLKEGDRTFIGIGKMAVNDDLEMLKIDVETPLEFNETYSLSLEFAGSINKSPRGLYKSFSNYGERITVTGTHFQPTYARRAFPCFDEPALRATFSVVVVRPKNYRSFSNMAISKSEERHEGLPQGYDETICQRMKLRCVQHNDNLRTDSAELP
ncbi:putative protease m1 zinc metalloprotease [Ixodes scapularis]